MMTAPHVILSQNYHLECAAAINYQISLELYTSLMFETTASYFNSQDVALKHFVQFFLQPSSQEMEHVQGLMWLQNQCGAHLSLQDIYRSDLSCWENGLMVMECAFHLKISVNQSLFNLHQLAVAMRDANMCDFPKSHYLLQQRKIIEDLEDHTTNLRQMEATELGLAEDLCTKLTLGDSAKELTLDYLSRNHRVNSPGLHAKHEHGKTFNFFLNILPSFSNKAISS